MLKGLGDLGQLLKLQKEMKNMQNRLAKAVIEGSDPGGLVKAAVNGEYRLVRIDLPDELRSLDRGKAEKAVMQAVNDAVDRMKEHSAAELDKMKGSFQIPGMDQFLK